MKFSAFLQIIKEEVQGFFSDWSMGDEPSIADKYYQTQYGIDTKTPEKEFEENDAEIIGYVTKGWNRQPIPVSIPIYKNPKNLKGISKETRAVLLKNGDFYVAKSFNAAHEMILEQLAEKRIIPYQSQFNYNTDYPSEFVAVQRSSETNNFVQSMAYVIFPNYYIEIFDTGNTRQPYHFEVLDINEQTQSPLDPNWMMSNIPQGHNPNILYEKNVKKC